MSRIVGVIGPNQSLSNSLPSMLCHMHGRGLWKNDFVFLGDAALGVTALKNHNIAQADHLCCVVDGLFYNRDELPRGANLAEIVIASYRQQGFQKTLQSINGDFAIALYDAKEEVLYLGRDRIGLRPLYYALHDGCLTFASRPLALLPMAGFDVTPNVTFTGLFAGSHYRTFDNDRHASPYQEISQLPASHILEYKNNSVALLEYWKLSDFDDNLVSDEFLAEQYKSILIDSVGRRFSQVENPAFTLSGGMDSSSVLSCAVEYSGEKQIAYSSIYRDPTYDESDEIKSMIDYKVHKWNAVRVDAPNTLKLIREMITLHDEPVATATWLSHYILANKVSEAGHDALFGGLGGDELNGGEYEYFFYLFADLKYEGREQELYGEIAQWIKYHDHSIFKKNYDIASLGWKKLADMSKKGHCLADRARIEKYAHTVNIEYFDVRSFEPPMSHLFPNYMKNRTYQDIFFETAPCCIRAEDRQTVPFGLDNILPFFDYRIVEFMFGVANRHKIRGGITKRLLREAMAGLLPDKTRERIVKTGWNAPAHIWFSGKGLEELRDIVTSQNFKNLGIYNVKNVEQLFDEHEAIINEGQKKENHMMFFWQLANMLTWLDYVDEIRLKNKN